jgi:hypothetical protein
MSFETSPSRSKSIEQLIAEANELREKFIEAYANYDDANADLLWDAFKEAEKKAFGAED